MTRRNGLRLQNAWADYIRAWFPRARSTPNGIGGTDVQNTPGIFWEVKTIRTGDDGKNRFEPYKWVKSAADRARGADLPVAIFFPERIGEKRCDQAIMMIPAEAGMRLLERAGYTETSPAASNVETGPSVKHPEGLAF
jgi:hypothetical protein